MLNTTSPILKRLDHICKEGVPLGHTKLWQLAFASSVSGWANARMPLSRAKKLKRKRVQALRCYSQAEQVIARLNGCALNPCGSAACPLCCTFIDVFLTGWCGQFLKEAERPWLLIWVYTPLEPGEADLSSLQPDNVRFVLGERLAAAGLSDLEFLGRMSLKVQLADPAQGTLRYFSAIGMVASPKTAIDLAERLQAQQFSDTGLHLMSAEAVSAGDPIACAQAQADLDDTFDDYAEGLIAEEPGWDERRPGRAERRGRRPLIELAEKVMARHWGHLDYSDLLIGMAVHEVREILSGELDG